MNDWSTQTFQGRFQLAGDLSEAACEQWMQAKGVSLERFGFNRSSLPKIWTLPLKIRTRPDYLAIGKSAFFIEVKGCGRSPFIKIKDMTVEGLDAWQKELDVWMFFYDSHKHQVSFDFFPTIRTTILDSPYDYFQEGHKFYKLPKKDLTWEPFTVKEEVYGY